MSNPQKAKGSKFERDMERFLDALPGVHRAWRTAPTGYEGSDIMVDLALGEGVVGVTEPVTAKLIVECKNYVSPRLGTWIKQVELDAGVWHDEMGEDRVPVIMWKRRGATAPDQQWVTMTAGAFAHLLAQLHGE